MRISISNNELNKMNEYMDRVQEVVTLASGLNVDTTNIQTLIDDIKTKKYKYIKVTPTIVCKGVGATIHVSEEIIIGIMDCYIELAAKLGPCAVKVRELYGMFSSIAVETGENINKVYDLANEKEV